MKKLLIALLASFSMTACSQDKKQNTNTTSTEWHNIICWRNLAENAEKYLNKGKMIYLEGKLRTRSWEDNGQKRYITEIDANTFTMLSTKSENEGGQAVVTQVQNVATATPTQQSAPEYACPPDETTDDLPF